MDKLTVIVTFTYEPGEEYFPGGMTETDMKEEADIVRVAVKNLGEGILPNLVIDDIQVKVAETV